jgi:transcriptional regulator with XRE-family HTH domain
MATPTLAGVPRDEIGTVLSILRCARGLSQEELGRSSGIRSTSISDYERGHTVPTVKKVVRLVAAMGYPLAALDHTRAYLETLRAGGCSVALPQLPFGRGGAGPETPRAALPVETGAP